MIVPILYGNEKFNDLTRIRRTCGIRLIGLRAYRGWYGVDSDEYKEISKKIDKLQNVIFEVSQKLAHGNEQKALHYYFIYMKYLDKKFNTVNDVVKG